LTSDGIVDGIGSAGTSALAALAGAGVRERGKVAVIPGVAVAAAPSFGAVEAADAGDVGAVEAAADDAAGAGGACEAA